MIELYKIKKGSRIKITDENGKHHMIIFHHLDGMYSYCTTEKLDRNGEATVIHLSALTPLVEHKKYYTIEKRDNEQQQKPQA